MQDQRSLLRESVANLRPRFLVAGLRHFDHMPDAITLAALEQIAGPNANIVSNVFNKAELVIDQPSAAPFIGGNTFNNANGYSNADHTAFMGNTFAFTDGRQYASAITIYGGTGHNIRSNTINGGWDGFNEVGADDGIILSGRGPNDPISAYVAVTP